MIEYFDNHLYSFWFATGFILLGLELLVLGFSTGFVLFIGLAALVTGGLLWFAILPSSWAYSTASFAILSVGLSAALWKPFKSLEPKGDTPPPDSSSDLIGHQFRLQTEISHTQAGSTRYSGISWRVVPDSSLPDTITIAAGKLVTVSSLDAGVFRVKPVSMTEP